MSLINSVNLIISLENKILITNKEEKKQRFNEKDERQYYENISLQYSKNISKILFVNKVKIK